MPKKKWSGHGKRNGKKSSFWINQQLQQEKSQKRKRDQYCCLNQPAVAHQVNGFFSIFTHELFKLWLADIKISLPESAIFREIGKHTCRHDPCGGHGRMVIVKSILKITMRKGVIIIGAGDHPPRLVNGDDLVNADDMGGNDQHKQKKDRQQNIPFFFIHISSHRSASASKSSGGKVST